MKNLSIGIIGAGNMGLALGSGLAAGSLSQLAISDPHADKRRAAEQLGIATEADNEALVERVNVLVLAVKPQHLPALCRTLAPAVARRRPLIVSVAAGARTSDISRWLGGDVAVVRAMPNTPALLKAGVSVLYGNAQVTASDRTAAETVLRAVSEVFWVDHESLMDAVTAVSGSGPAYLFLFLEAFIKAGAQVGLPEGLCTALAVQTTLGAARMAQAEPDAVTELRRRVTSPNGTTEQAVKSFLADGFLDMFARAVSAAAQRSQHIGDELGAL